MRRGHILEQAGDGEVLVHLYEEYGLDFPSKLRGTFAIALWDERLRRLLLVRDRVGVKPLYVRFGSGGLAFALRPQEGAFQSRVLERKILKVGGGYQ